MKQHITKEQWQELSERQKHAYCKPLDLTWKEEYPLCSPPNIGQMIEFLGDEIMELARNPIDGSFIVACQYCRKEGLKFPTGELCDALWEAVKLKLNATL